MGHSTCSFPDCGKRVNARGLCPGHYRQHMLGQQLKPLGKRALSVPDRFASKVSKSGPTVPGHPDMGRCWAWLGDRKRNGDTGCYGMFKIKDTIYAAHRISYEMHKGPIPDGMLVDHICHNGLCVRPEHLRLATRAQNNSYLKGAKSNNKSSGVRNVYRSGRKSKPGWVVYVKRQYGGVYDTIEEAERAARAKRAELFDFPDF